MYAYIAHVISKEATLMTQEIVESFGDIGLRNKEAFEMLDSILRPFDIFLDHALFLDGGERTYDRASPIWGNVHIQVLCEAGQPPWLAITLSDDRPVLALEFDYDRMLIQQPKARHAKVVAFDLVRLFQALLEWIRYAAQTFIALRSPPLFPC